jgi:hypothetical protein
MILFEWLGKDGDAQPFSLYSNGAGQSGTVALHTTAGEVLTNAKSLLFTQQTSSGDGKSAGLLYINRPLSFRRVRLLIAYRILNNDADFDTIALVLRDYDGVNSRQYALRQQSNAGATEEIQYLDSGGSNIDTTFRYPTDQGLAARQWHDMGFDADFTAKTYTRMSFDAAFDLSAVDAYESSTSDYPGMLIDLSISGGTTLVSLAVDSIRLEVID